MEWDRNHDRHTVGYQVSAGLASGSYIAQFDVAGRTRLTLDLPQGGAYYLVVRGYDARRQLGPASTEMVVDLTAPPRDPLGVRASVADGLTTLDWDPPSAGGRPLQYLVSVGTSPGGVDVVNGHAVGPARSARGVLPPGVYFARVQAQNLVGVGPPSSDISFEIGSSRRLQGPRDLSVRWHGAHAVLSWSPPAGSEEDPPSAYVLEAGTAPGLANLGSLNIGAATSYTTTVPPGTHFVRVRAISAGGRSDPSNEIAVPGPQPPGAPVNLAASGDGTSVSLQWSAPAGAPVSAYLLEAGTAPGLSNIGVLNVGNLTTFTTGARPGVYYVRVRAANAVGIGAPSAEIVVGQ